MKIFFKKKYLTTILTFVVLLCCHMSLKAQSIFPVHKIDTAILKSRDLETKVHMIVNECDWQNRIGEKIDVFWLKNENGNFFGHVYEYILDCDNLRLIYWYTNAAGTGPIVDFMIEDVEDESMFVVAKKRHLKHKKSLQQYLRMD